jgi:hypothetical protein
VRLAATAELGYVDISGPDFAERGGECLRAELGMAPRSGLRPNVRERPDLRGAERRQELLERARAVADGPDLHRSQCERLDR